jgi:hypothetical protein
MVFFTLIGNSYDKGYHYDMKKTGEIITPTYLINTDSIDSIKDWKGKLSLEGKSSCEVIMKSGKSYIDYRTKEELIKDISRSEKTFTENDMKNFGLWLGNNLKNNKGKTIDNLFDIFINQ